ncbi:hypothetical protein C8Q70DRAFT_192067 [Cubamyces menziesii]|nr:hypothetical protein C8Q70DRAFT_192067 [Cubamyces menziesii]
MEAPAITEAHMHPALSNPDIIYSIFAHLNPLPDALATLRSGQDLHKAVLRSDAILIRSALKNAALVCRAFAGPASDALWSVLHAGFAPLFYTFKGFEVIRKRQPLLGPDLYSVEHVLNGPVSADDWARWEDRAQRVRCFVFADHARWQLDAAFLPVLMDRARDLAHPLFPNLQAFAVRESLGYPPRRGLLFALAHSSASLSAVTVATRIPLPFHETLAEDLEELQAGLAMTGARLRYMNVYSHYQCIHVTLPFARFGDLRTVHTSPMTLAGYRYAVTHLSALEELEELIIAVDDDPERAGGLAGKPLGGIYQYPLEGKLKEAFEDQGGFRALHKLSLDGTHSEVGELTQRIKSATLEDVSLVSNQDFTSDITKLVKPLGSEHIAASLRKVHLSLDTNFALVASGADAIHAPFADVLRPLFRLHALEELEVTSWHRVLSISDEDVWDMATAWPFLRSLIIASDSKSSNRARIAWTPYAPSISRPSIPALVHLAEECRQLTRLRVDVADMSEEDLHVLETHVAVATARQTQLMHWIPAWGDHCLHLSLPDIDRLAQALHQLFPSLKGSGSGGEGWHRPGRPMKHWWTEEEQETAAYRFMEKFNEWSR